MLAGLLLFLVNRGPVFPLPAGSSLNDSYSCGDVDERGALVAAAQGEVTHFPLDSPGIAPVAAGGDKLVENFLQHRVMELFPVLRGE